jgi:hypothetical protein
MPWNAGVRVRIYLFIGKGIPSGQIRVQENSITSEVRFLSGGDCGNGYKSRVAKVDFAASVVGDRLP